jgi:hypothetical protein
MAGRHEDFETLAVFAARATLLTWWWCEEGDVFKIGYPLSF